MSAIISSLVEFLQHSNSMHINFVVDFKKFHLYQWIHGSNHIIMAMSLHALLFPHDMCILIVI